MSQPDQDSSEEPLKAVVPRKKRSSLLKKRVALFAGSLTLSLCSVEVGFRLKAPLGHEAMLFGAPDFSDPDLYTADSEMLLVPTPGYQGKIETIEYSTTVRINSQGVRGPEIGPREKDEIRLLALGDSFTLGVQVEEEETYVAILSSILSQKMKRPVRIINAGVDGFGTQQSLRMAERLDALYDVDGAFLLFFTGNDFWENQSFESRNKMQQNLDIPPPEPQLSFWDRTLGRVSYAYAFVRVHFRTRSMRSDPHQLRRYSQELRIFDASSGELDDQMMQTERALFRLGEHCRKENWFCAMPVAPPAFVVDEKRAGSTFDLVGMETSRVDLSRPSRKLLASEAYALPRMDLLEALRGANEDTYFRFDGHWNPHGHEVVARAIADWIEPQIEAFFE